MNVVTVTAEDLRLLFSKAVTTCEMLEMIEKDRQLLVDDPGCVTAGLVRDTIDNGFADEGEHLTAIGNLLNSLADELLSRERQCIEYTADVRRHLALVDAWDSALQLARQLGLPFDEPYPGNYPDPPFPGATPSI